MQKILPVNISTNDYAQIVEKVVELPRAMRPDGENTRSQIFLTLKGSKTTDW